MARQAQTHANPSSGHVGCFFGFIGCVRFEARTLLGGFKSEINKEHHFWCFWRCSGGGFPFAREISFGWSPYSRPHTQQGCCEHVRTMIPLQAGKRLSLIPLPAPYSGQALYCPTFPLGATATSTGIYCSPHGNGGSPTCNALVACNAGVFEASSW